MQVDLLWIQRFKFYFSIYSKVWNIPFDIRYTGEDYGNNKAKDRVMPAQIPELAKQNFPLCMKSMQEVLKIS